MANMKFFNNTYVMHERKNSKHLSYRKMLEKLYTEHFLNSSCRRYWRQQTHWLFNGYYIFHWTIHWF